MVAAGWALVWEADDDDEVARKQLRAERKALKDAWIDAVAQADPMPLEDAKAILRSNAARADRARALAAVLRDKLGLEGKALGREIVRAWLFGGLGSQIRVFGLWQLMTDATRDHVATSVAWQLGRLCESSVMPQAYLSMVDLFSTVMAAYGVTPKMETINILKDPILGVTAPTDRDHQDDGNTLSTGGITRIRTQKRINGVVTSTYTIDPASVERMTRMTARWLERRGVLPKDNLDAQVKALLDD